MISFCYPIKNRTLFVSNHNDNKVLTTPLIKSAISVASCFDNNQDYEIVIADFMSTDTDYEWLKQMQINHKIVKIDYGKYFNRGMGLNTAYEASSGERVFFIDADMLVNRQFLQRCNEVLDKPEYNLFFPVCWSYSNPEHSEGYWRHTGYGNVIVNKEFWKKNNMSWWERDSWGREDSELFGLHESHSFREESPGFYHMWHDEKAHLSSVYKNHHAKSDSRGES